MDHWFVQNDEPDTISNIASRAAIPTQHRSRNPLASFYDSFPSWTKNPIYATIQTPSRRVDTNPSIIRMDRLDDVKEATRLASLPARSRIVAEALLFGNAFVPSK